MLSGTDNSDLPAERGSTLYQLLTHPDKVAVENLTVETFQVRTLPDYCNPPKAPCDRPS